MEGITSFFFNIIPGALLIFILEKYTDFQIIVGVQNFDPKQESIFFWIIIFSIFLGFLFQAFSKFIKEHYLYDPIFRKIICENDLNYRRAKEVLETNGLLEKSKNLDKKELERMFFTMDNYLSYYGGGRLLTHFASRLAYWFNLFWASLIIVMLSLLGLINNDFSVGIGFIFLIFTGYETYKHLFNHYDILLKTFVSVIEIDDKKLGKSKLKI